jgi:RNase P protein component
MKRRLREVVRLELLPEVGALDLTIRPSRAAYRLSFNELRAEIVDVRDVLKDAER